MNETQRRILNIATIVQNFKDSNLGKRTSRGVVSAVESYVYLSDFFTVNPTTGALDSGVAVGGTVQQTTDIQADADFFLIYINGYELNAEMINYVRPLVVGSNSTIQFTNNTSNRSLFSAPAFLATVTGNGGEPYIMQQGELLHAKSQLITTITNNSADVTYYQIAFCGLKVFYDDMANS